MAKPKDQAADAADVAAAPESATMSEEETKSLKRGPFEITFKRVAGSPDDPTHYDVTVSKDGKQVQPGEASPELEHLDVHFEFGGANALSKRLFDFVFGWIERQPEA